MNEIILILQFINGFSLSSLFAFFIPSYRMLLLISVSVSVLFYRKKIIRVNNVFILYLIIPVVITYVLSFKYNFEFLRISIFHFAYFIVTIVGIYWNSYVFQKNEKLLNRSINIYVSFLFILFAIYLYFYYISRNSDYMIPLRLNNQKLLFDYDKRFFGFASEPSFLGFSLGSMFFLICAERKNTKSKNLVIFCLFIILFYFNRAKFSLIAFPFSFVFSLILIKFFTFKKYNFFFVFGVFSLLLFLILFIRVDFIGSKIQEYIPYNGSGTFVTRFGIILASFKSLFIMPFGYGFGGYLYYRNDLFLEIIYSMKESNITELMYYLNDNVSNLDSKDTLSFIYFIFGFPGLLFLSYVVSKYINIGVKSNNVYFLSLILYIIFSSFVYINIFSVFSSCYFIGYIDYYLRSRNLK